MAKHRAARQWPKIHWSVWFAILTVLVALLVLAAAATVIVTNADPVCGPGMNWDWKHQICQPGNPVPYPPYPYPSSPYPSG